jgi:hypothetical protein
MSPSEMNSAAEYARRDNQLQWRYSQIRIQLAHNRPFIRAERFLLAWQ